jgi:protein TonB
MTNAAFAVAALSLAGCAPQSSIGGPAPAASCDGASVVDTAVYSPDSVARKPAIIESPPPVYPEELRRAGIPCRVVVAFIIGPDGRVERASLHTVEAANIDFSASAMTAISKALFTPACKNGHPVRIRVTMPVEFKMTN